MFKKDTSLETITDLLAVARDWEKKGNRDEALDVYRDVLSRLTPESPLKQEIEIIVEHLEDRSKPVIRQEPAAPLLWKIALAFLAGLVLMGLIIVSLGKWNIPPSSPGGSPKPTGASFTRTVASSALPATLPPDTREPTQNTSSSQTSLPTENTIFLTAKSNPAYLREGPHLNHPVVLTVQRGTQFEVSGKYATNDGFWFYVTSKNGEKGWLLQRWVTIDPEMVGQIPTVTHVPTTPPNKAVPTKRTYP